MTAGKEKAAREEYQKQKEEVEGPNKIREVAGQQDNRLQ
jgi:hypothetical protein